MKSIQNRQIVVLSLIFLLLNITITNCNTITEQYNKEYSFLQQSIQTLQDNRDQLQQQLDEVSSDRQSCHLVEWIQNKTQSNQNNAENLLDNRCREHVSFLEFVYNGRITLRLIQFLRGALNDFSFTQMGAVTKIFSDFTQYPANKLGNTEALKMMFKELDSIKKNNFDSLSLLERIRQRTDVGQGHIDEEREDFELNQWEDQQINSHSQERLQLSSLLDEFEAFLNNELDRREDAEVTSNEQVALFVNHLNEENQDLNEHLVVQQENCEQATNDLADIDTEYNELASQIEEANLQIASRNQLINPYEVLSGQLVHNTAQQQTGLLVESASLVLPDQILLNSSEESTDESQIQDQPQVFQQQINNQQSVDQQEPQPIQYLSLDAPQVTQISKINQDTQEDQVNSVINQQQTNDNEDQEEQIMSAAIEQIEQQNDEEGNQSELLSIKQTIESNNQNDQTDDKQQIKTEAQQQYIEEQEEMNKAYQNALNKKILADESQKKDVLKNDVKLIETSKNQSEQKLEIIQNDQKQAHIDDDNQFDDFDYNSALIQFVSKQDRIKDKLSLISNPQKKNKRQIKLNIH